MQAATLYDRIQDTAAYLRARTSTKPSVGVVLGSGLGGLADWLSDEQSFPYSGIPDFPQATVQGHAGQLLFGNLSGVQVVMQSGRFHYYEGYSMEELTFPVRVMRALGVETLIVSNAAGAMNPAYSVGDIVLLRDHINLFPEHPLRGPADERLGPRFPDMSEPYSLALLEKAEEAAKYLNISTRRGVYVGLQGPTFETRAEYEWLRRIGGDVVGMSTVPEVIAAIHRGMKVLGASVVTDIGIREEQNVISHEDVLQAAAEAAPKLALLMAEVVSRL